MTALPCNTAQEKESCCGVPGGDEYVVLINFLMIGLPIIIVACIAACVTCCVCKARRNKARRRAEAEAATLAAVAAAHAEHAPPAYSLEQYGGQSSSSRGSDGQGVGAASDGEEDEPAKMATTAPAPAYQPR